MDTHLFKVGHFTMDNASNNETMMQELQILLAGRDVSFDPVNRRVMCFAHVVNLCSGRVIHGISQDKGDSFSAGDDAVPSNPIDLARAVVRNIRASGPRRDHFKDIIQEGNTRGYFRDAKSSQTVHVKNNQLLRDVCTRWDSVYQMIRRLREMCPVSHYFSPHRMKYMLNCRTFRLLITFSLFPITRTNWASIGFHLKTGIH